MIDVEFYKIEKVIEDWNLYRDYLNSPQPQYQTANAPWHEKRQEYFTNMLYTMAKFLGYDFDKVLIKNGAYFPQALGNIFEAQLQLMEILKGNQSLSIQIVKSDKNAAERLLSSPPLRKNGRFISSDEAFFNTYYLKTVCYLFAISIELFLKALYCLNKTTEEEEVETFSHKLVKLKEALVKKNVINENELEQEMLEFGEILLQWFGRYHKPKDVDKTIQMYFDEISPNYPTNASTNIVICKPKFSADLQTVNRLKNL